MLIVVSWNSAPPFGEQVVFCRDQLRFNSMQDAWYGNIRSYAMDGWHGRTLPLDFEIGRNPNCLRFVWKKHWGAFQIFFRVILKKTWIDLKKVKHGIKVCRLSFLFFPWTWASSWFIPCPIHLVCPVNRRCFFHQGHLCWSVLAWRFTLHLWPRTTQQDDAWAAKALATSRDQQPERGEHELPGFSACSVKGLGFVIGSKVIGIKWGNMFPKMQPPFISRWNNPFD